MLPISYYLHFHFTRAAFPIERYVAEIAGVSPLKRWIAFMEKITKVCLNDINTKDSSGVFEILECMTKKDITQRLQGKYLGRTMTIIHRYPNILHAEIHTRIQIIVHDQFNLNVTVIYYFEKHDFFQTGEFYLTISGKRYMRLLYPFTFMSSSNSLEISFPFDIDICIGIEYSIGQRFKHTNYHQMEANLVYYLWGYFPVTCFRTHVDMRARLALNITSCLHCKLIVYDGPSGKLPIIMEIKGTSRYQTVVASTFQVFVALIEELYQQETVITYTPIYINTAVYNLSTTDTVEISFDNRTHCNGYSLYARLCVFVFYTSDRKWFDFPWRRTCNSVTNTAVVGMQQG